MARRGLLTLALFAVVASCGADEVSSAPARPTTWHVEGGAIRDAEGRTLIMRGVNFAGAHKQKPYLSSFTRDDMVKLRTEYGFNSLRFLVIWAGVEPEKGVFDETYLAGVEERIVWAKEAGLLVVLDMHQDLYGEGFLGGDGAPRWTCDASRYAAYEPTTPWFLGYLDQNVAACVDGLYVEDGEVRAHFIEAWRKLAERLKKHDNVLGFDILNEPPWGTYNILAFEEDKLAPFYEAVVKGVREVAPDWLVFAEPSGARNVGYATRLPKLSFGNVVYAPHAYDNEAESGNGFDETRREPLVRKLAELRADADAIDAALYIGEYGGQAEHPGIVPYMDAQFDGAGAVAASSAYWAFDKSDGYALLKPDGSEKKELADALSRPYPSRVAGKLLSYAFDDHAKVATFEYEPDRAIAAPTEIIIPPRVYPAGLTVECGGCSVDELPGLVRLKTAPPGDRVSVTIRAR